MKEECDRAKLTYLPPIDASITDFGTIYKLFEMLLLRAGKVNVPYVNLTLDYGTIVQTEITCKKVHFIICENQLAGGLLLKNLKYFEVMFNIFEFSRV